MGFFNSSEKHTTPTSSIEHAQNYPGATEGQFDDDLHVQCPAHTTERKLVTRIDLRVIPFLCILYLLAFLDRVNIANANVFGLTTELGLVGNQYNTALVIFFVPYILLEIPSNILLKKFAERMAVSQHVLLRIRHHHARSSQELLWSAGLPILPWCVRDRHVPWLLLSHRHVLSTTRSAEAIFVLLQLYNISRRFWWSSSCCNWQDEWTSRLLWLAMGELMTYPMSETNKW